MYRRVPSYLLMKYAINHITAETESKYSNLSSLPGWLPLAILRLFRDKCFGMDVYTTSKLDRTFSEALYSSIHYWFHTYRAMDNNSSVQQLIRHVTSLLELWEATSRRTLSTRETIEGRLESPKSSRDSTRIFQIIFREEVQHGSSPSLKARNEEIGYRFTCQTVSKSMPTTAPIVS